MTLLLLLGGAGNNATSTFDETHVWIFNGNWIEATIDIYEVSVTRGRSRELDEINAATARVRCRNHTGNFGPFTWGDYGTLEPGTPIVISYGTSAASAILGTVGIPIFFGFIEDFAYEWAPKRYTDVTLICGDGLSRVARQQFQEWTPDADQTPGERLTDVFARPEVGTLWLFGTNFDTGLSKLGSDTVSVGTNVLSYCQLINRTEQGRLFATKENVLRFQDRYTVGNPASAVVDFDDAATGAAAGEIPFQGIEVRYGAELLYDYVSVERAGGTVQTDSTGNADRHLTFSGLLFNSDSQSDDMASYLIDRYSTPAAVVSGIRVALEKLSAANREAIADIEIGDAVTLHWTPYQQSAVAETYVVEGISYSKGLTTATEFTFQLSAAPTNNFFILDDATNGVLDTSALGF